MMAAGITPARDAVTDTYAVSGAYRPPQHSLNIRSERRLKPSAAVRARGHWWESQTEAPLAGFWQEVTWLVANQLEYGTTTQRSYLLPVSCPLPNQLVTWVQILPMSQVHPLFPRSPQILCSRRCSRAPLPHALDFLVHKLPGLAVHGRFQLSWQRPLAQEAWVSLTTCLCQEAEKLCLHHRPVGVSGRQVPASVEPHPRTDPRRAEVLTAESLFPLLRRAWITAPHPRLSSEVKAQPRRPLSFGLQLSDVCSQGQPLGVTFMGQALSSYAGSMVAGSKCYRRRSQSAPSQWWHLIPHPVLYATINIPWGHGHFLHQRPKPLCWQIALCWQSPFIH